MRAGLFTLMRRSRACTLGGILVLAVVLVAVAAPVLSPRDPVRQNLPGALQPPSATFLLGTDQYGRDLLSRIIWGARISLLIGVIAVILGSFLGLLLGLTAGFYGGGVDRVLSRVIDSLLAFPGLLLALSVMAMLGANVGNAMIAVGISSSPRFARVIRGQVLSVGGKDFVEAARVVGASDLRIILRHILPNVLSPILVVATLGVGTAILTEANLSFLGLGVQPPTPTWGSMVSEGRVFVGTAFWVSLFPGIAIALTVLGFNLLGDGLRDVLDPRLRK
ncbi:MAG: ABC transporter permease [Armatimonadetes bacterium]|nr:ABC transporter permease [Armatimonadota bacterium]